MPKQPQILVLIGFVLVWVGQSALGLVESTGADGSNARAVHEQGIIGKGINVAMLSSGNALQTHEAFSGKAVVNHDFSGKGHAPNTHDTQVAAIVVSRGGSGQHADCRGVAPGAILHSARISDGVLSLAVVDRALHELIVNHGCRVVVTGIQMPSNSVKPDGQSPWSRMYDYYAEHYDVVFANASGNSESSITVFGDGYNGITTAGLALDENGRHRRIGAISNPGPTADGRRKPELAAPAQRQMMPTAAANTAWAAAGTANGETSFSAPHTAGAAALLLEYAAQTPTPHDDKSLTIKAVLINAADPNINDKADASTQPDELVWHPHRGFGRLDTARALQLLKAGQVRPDTVIRQSAGWAYETMDSYEAHTYRLDGKKGQRLVITAVWHRRLERHSFAAYRPENPSFNLLMQIKSANGETLFTESDFKNNLRKAGVVVPADGTVSILLQNQSLQSDRAYALAFEWISTN